MEPIAIIGLGCRFPGAAGPEAFWRLLCEGRSSITEVPPERALLRTYYDPDRTAPGKMHSRWGGFLEGVDQFDPGFFGIPPDEVASMDPQQRLLLEVAWEALEDAGQVPERLAGSPVGVFVGVAGGDYGWMQMAQLGLMDEHTNTGSMLTFVANRLSYVFDFRGPSAVVDSGCSASLVAVHMACQSLWTGDATLALAGGVNLLLAPALSVGFSKAGALSAAGRCQTFGAQADGYVRSEGGGLVVLKPLALAQADHDPVYAVLRGSAVNQNGRTNGLTAPSRWAQEAVLREAYRRAGVSPGRVQYIEVQGTGTLLGDLIEVNALGAVLAADRPAGQRCTLGSVKTNIGHLETAAGVAGLIKVALALKYRQIPPSLHFETPNPHIPFDKLPLRVQTSLGPWPEDARPALAGVSAFSFGGTNVHMVLEEAPPPRRTSGPPVHRCHLLPLSARSEAALRCLAQAYHDRLTAAGPAVLDVCYTASLRRGHHDHRLAVVGHSREELAESLRAFLSGEMRAGTAQGRYRPGRRLKLAFVFPEDASPPTAGRQLLDQEPAFRAALEQCDEAVRRAAGWSLLEAIRTGVCPPSRPEAAPLTHFALQVSLAALWRSWGVVPGAVVGQGFRGEVAAAQVAGVLTLPDAVRFLFQPGRPVAGPQPRPASTPVFSTTTGRPAEGRDLDAAYWERHARMPNLFPNAVESLLKTGCTTFLEVSAQPTLGETIGRCLRKQGIDGTVLPSLSAGREEQTALLSTLGALYTLGYALSWDRLYPDGGRCVPLPTYPWQRQRCWSEAVDRESRGDGFLFREVAGRGPATPS